MAPGQRGCLPCAHARSAHFLLQYGRAGLPRLQPGTSRLARRLSRSRQPLGGDTPAAPFCLAANTFRCLLSRRLFHHLFSLPSSNGRTMKDNRFLPSPLAHTPTYLHCTHTCAHVEGPACLLSCQAKARSVQRSSSPFFRSCLVLGSDKRPRAALPLPHTTRTRPARCLQAASPPPRTRLHPAGHTITCLFYHQTFF